ncbi:hypothetical protein FHG87_015818, partial [Trinorchestia longiramus]
MPRQRYNLKELMSDVFGSDKAEGPNSSPQPLLDMNAAVLSLGQYPIPEENGERSDISVVRGLTPTKNGSVENHNNGVDESNGDEENGKKNGEEKAPKLLLDVRHRSDFSYYAKRMPGLVN